MEIFGLGLIDMFIQGHVDARGPLEAWVAHVRNARWTRNTDIRGLSASATFVGNRRVVFNIKGNRYRLDVQVDYLRQIVLVKRIGTHAEYDKWKF